jgi:hypothetical protein
MPVTYRYQKMGDLNLKRNDGNEIYNNSDQHSDGTRIGVAFLGSRKS